MKKYSEFFWFFKMSRVQVFPFIAVTQAAFIKTKQVASVLLAVWCDFDSDTWFLRLCELRTLGYHDEPTRWMH